jgi:hypothetical protein
LTAPRFIVGIDLGQAHDPTAIAVAEPVADDIHLRHLERRPLGEPYPAVVAHVRALVRALPGAELVVDATGVGRAVLDQMRDAGLEPVAVTITSGKKARRDGSGGWRVPKVELLRPLVSAVEAGRLKVAAGLPDAEALARELGAFERAFTAAGHATFDGVGEHDDLVIAAALACWRIDRE